MAGHECPLRSAGQIDEDANMDLGNLFWMGVAVAVVGIGAWVFATARRPSGQDLGSVSSQWIAEQRAQADGRSR